jgi:CheY-like chemotaxis protein
LRWLLIRNPLVITAVIFTPLGKRTKLAFMKVNALVISRSQASVKLLLAAFAELGIEYRIALSASETIENLGSEQHSALIVDFDLPQAVQVARAARAMAGRQRPVVFGMIGADIPIAEVFQAGANFVLYKPLDLLQVLHSFRAAQGFMRADRRRSSRPKTETLAYLQLPTGTIPALVQDLTEQGISIQAAQPLLPMRGIRLRFLLPRSTQVVHARGDFIWADEEGHAGLFFSDMPAACRRDLQAWFKKNEPKRADSVRSLLEPRKHTKVFTATAH